MKTSKKPGVRKILLAAVLALPLLTIAADMETDQPPAPHGEREGPAPFGGPQHGGPEQGGPDRGPGLGPAFGHGAGRGFGPGRPPFFHGLELSEAQEDKAFAILHAEAPYLREQFKAAAKAREALRALASADKYDDAKAAALSREAATAEANIALQHVRTQQKLLAVLTPEQRKQQADDKPRRPQRP